jgi:UDP-N-acetylglucosamine/UDP-N-acetylgalactosamine diphosphorylase
MAAAVKETVHNILDKIQGKGENTPREPPAEELQQLKEKYEKAGQGHVFTFFNELKSVEKGQLFQQLSTFDPNRINELADIALHPPKTSAEEQASLEPLPESATASILDSDPKDLERWYNAGLELVGANKVAVVLLAGGQGTRLGSSAPKGCFNIGLPSQKSLFQIQAERIAKIELLAEKVSGKKAVVPWYVMTSGPTREPTEEFFREHNYFGLGKDNIMFFEQGVLPCISNEGKILLESKSKVCLTTISTQLPFTDFRIGRRCSRRQRWYLSSSFNLWSARGHATSRNRTHPHLLR